MANHSIIRITRELADIQKSSDLSIAVACRDIDVRNVMAVIVGPHETPYESGFFEFNVKFGKEYPAKPPSVQATTTNAGRTRFNPNIYAQGKVCLSILGTWRGESGEEWSAAQGLESILISIQSLLSSNPYENEPGFESANQPQDQKHKEDYVMKIRHETLRVSVIQRLESYLNLQAPATSSGTPKKLKLFYDSPDDELGSDTDAEIINSLAPYLADPNTTFEPFKDFCKRRFLWYYDTYLLAIRKAKEEVTVGQPFARMPFECASNGMVGKFNYPDLEIRLSAIRHAIHAETATWAMQGLNSMRSESTIATNLQHQFKQLVEQYQTNKNVTLDIDLVDKNPFVWSLTYFGRPMTNLDGGLFRITLHFSPRFPEEQLRAKFETPLFHHRITTEGIPCYTAARSDDIKSHIESIIEVLEDESPRYDPRMRVNPEAARLYWGSAADKKLYNRQLRRAVQKTTES